MVQIHYRLPNKNNGLEDIGCSSNPLFYGFSNGFLTESDKTVMCIMETTGTESLPSPSSAATWQSHEALVWPSCTS
jgi:hypothetical protein